MMMRGISDQYSVNKADVVNNDILFDIVSIRWVARIAPYTIQGLDHNNTLLSLNQRNFASFTAMKERLAETRKTVSACEWTETRNMKRWGENGREGKRWEEKGRERK